MTVGNTAACVRHSVGCLFVCKPQRGPCMTLVEEKNKRRLDCHSAAPSPPFSRRVNVSIGMERGCQQNAIQSAETWINRYRSSCQSTVTSPVAPSTSLGTHWASHENPIRSQNFQCNRVEASSKREYVSIRPCEHRSAQLHRNFAAWAQEPKR